MHFDINRGKTRMSLNDILQNTLYPFGASRRSWITLSQLEDEFPIIPDSYIHFC